MLPQGSGAAVPLRALLFLLENCSRFLFSRSLPHASAQAPHILLGEPHPKTLAKRGATWATAAQERRLNRGQGQHGKARRPSSGPRNSNPPPRVKTLGAATEHRAPPADGKLPACPRTPPRPPLENGRQTTGQPGGGPPDLPLRKTAKHGNPAADGHGLAKTALTPPNRASARMPRWGSAGTAPRTLPLRRTERAPARSRDAPSADKPTRHSNQPPPTSTAGRPRQSPGRPPWATTHCSCRPRSSRCNGGGLARQAAGPSGAREAFGGRATGPVGSTVYANNRPKRFRCPSPPGSGWFRHHPGRPRM